MRRNAWNERGLSTSSLTEFTEKGSEYLKKYLVNHAMNFFEKFLNRNRKEEKEGHGPIKACIGNPESFVADARSALVALRARHVDYFEPASTQIARGEKTGGDRSYVLSNIDDTNKGSTSYLNCTGAILVGTDRRTGKNISLLTHQDPWFFLGDGQKKFLQDFRGRLLEFKQRTVPGSIDSVLFGGNLSEIISERIKDDPSATFSKDYRDAIVLLTACIKDAVNKDPEVISGPNRSMGATTDVWFDTKKRRIYIMQSDTDDGQ